MKFTALLVGVATVIACGDATEDTYTIAGTVSGLTGTGLVLQNNAGDDLSVSSTATTFAFRTPLKSGSAYAVTVLTQPTAPAQICSVVAGNGAIATSDITGVVVTCVTGMWKSVSAGGYHNLAIRTDGTLWAWGENTEGQLGDGTLDNQPAPVQIGTATSWATISAGGGHSLATRTDGTLWAWGDNFYGQLGDGSNADHLVPTQVGTSTDWASIAAGFYHGLATHTDGTLWAWGRNNSGQLGDTSTSDRNAPVQVGTSNTWASIAAGEAHNLARQADGTLWAWGDDARGQLGGGATGNKSVPTQVGTDTDWASADAGGTHSLAIRTNGTLWAWGGNGSGQLGDGTAPTNKSIPTQVGTDTNWASVSAAAAHSLATRIDGTFWAWGFNTYGQVGDGTSGAGTNKSVPTQIGSLTSWAFVSGGGDYSLARRSDGTHWAWGRNSSGQLGDGSTNPTNVPIEILKP